MALFWYATMIFTAILLGLVAITFLLLWGIILSVSKAIEWWRDLLWERG